MELVLAVEGTMGNERGGGEKEGYENEGFTIQIAIDRQAYRQLDDFTDTEV